MIPINTPPNSRNSAFKVFPPKEKSKNPTVFIPSTNVAENIPPLNKRKIEILKSDDNPSKKPSILSKPITLPPQFFSSPPSGVLNSTQHLYPNIMGVKPTPFSVPTITQTHVLKNGPKYVGDFVDCSPHGKGTLILKNGLKYVDNFVDCSPHGKGSFVSNNGDKYEGDFVNGLRHGKGIEIDKDGNTSAVDYVNGIKK